MWFICVARIIKKKIILLSSELATKAIPLLKRTLIYQYKKNAKLLFLIESKFNLHWDLLVIMITFYFLFSSFKKQFFFSRSIIPLYISFVSSIWFSASKMCVVFKSWLNCLITSKRRHVSLSVQTLLYRHIICPQNRWASLN